MRAGKTILITLILLFVFSFPVLAMPAGAVPLEDPPPAGLSPLAFMAVILFLGFLIERLVEAIFGRPFDKFPILTPYKWALIYIAFIAGVVAAFTYQLDLVSLLAQYLNVPLPHKSLGVLLTGLSMGAGSTLIHEIITRFFSKPAGA